jgi:hypothetical protein
VSSMVYGESLRFLVDGRETYRSHEKRDFSLCQCIFQPDRFLDKKNL